MPTNLDWQALAACLLFSALLVGAVTAVTYARQRPLPPGGPEVALLAAGFITVAAVPLIVAAMLQARAYAKLALFLAVMAGVAAGMRTVQLALG